MSTDQFDAFWGTQDAGEPLVHERTMAFRQPNAAGPGYWLVVDRLTGKGKHRLDQRWHATERLHATAGGDTVTLTVRRDGTDRDIKVVLGEAGG